MPAVDQRIRLYFKEDLTQTLLVPRLSLQICPCHLRRRLVWLEVHRRVHFSDPVDYVTVPLAYPPRQSDDDGDLES